MALPVNIDELINGQTVESERLEFKEGWKVNGSPPPVFETNKDRDYFLTILPIHPRAKKKAQVEAQVVPSLSQVNAIRNGK